MALAAFALAAPVTAGRWSLALLGIPLIALGVAEALRHFHFASACRRERLPAVSARNARREPVAVEFRLGAQRPIDSAGRNSSYRWSRQDPDRLAPAWRGAHPRGRQRGDRSRMCGAALVSQSDHRRGAGDRNRRRRLYRDCGLADADGPGRGHQARCHRHTAGRSPRRRARSTSERHLRAPARRSRRCVADSACRRYHVDADPCGRLPGDPCRPHADRRQSPRRQFSLRCDRRGRPDDVGPGGASDPSGATPLAAADETSGAFGVVVAAQRKVRRCADESRG